MGTKNKKQQQQAMAKREAQIRNLPTIYTFNFKDVPADKYTAALESLFSNPDFAEAVPTATNSSVLPTAFRRTRHRWHPSSVPFRRKTRSWP